MSKIAVVYWSGTGNTEAMANEGSDTKGISLYPLFFDVFIALMVE
mgnify:CR=1 FL=1